MRAAFIDPDEFWSSPLYRQLCSVVAADPFLVELAANARAGQGPTFAFFAAVQSILLSGTAHALADYYPSVRGGSARPLDGDVGAGFAVRLGFRFRDLSAASAMAVRSLGPPTTMSFRLAIGH